MVKIIAYNDSYHTYFRQLNVEWLELYGLSETHDFEVLDNPHKYVLQNGGHIFLAQQGDNIVGTAALVKLEDGVYELAKMSVAPAMRGAGIGTLLLQHCLTVAKQLHARQILLYSNSKLQAAIKMYEKFGFKHIPVVDSPFVTADIKMQLSL